MKYSDYLDIHPDVEKAIKNKEPVVALESTIISHGMPYPKNVETALMVEDTVRSNKAVPATIAIINGRLKVGLTNEEIEFLATNEEVKKVSRRDLPITVAQKAFRLYDSCVNDDYCKSCQNSCICYWRHWWSS
jgi:pseudouridine-5'-phosphate glycosidase